MLNAAYVGKLHDLSITVKIVKINSHLGILENDMADRYAKEMASKISKAEIIAPRNVSVSDCLPNSVVDACTANAFKARLDKFWKHQSVKFDFTADLTGTGNRSEEVIK